MIYVEWPLVVCEGVDDGETSFGGLFFLAKCQAKAKNII
jgi:hypothetical protein